MAYTPSYTKPYPSGYKNKPNETTPITADVMNGYDNAIVSIETYLEENPIEGGGGGTSEHVYSTTPKIVGKWIDGKDLYEVVFECHPSTTAYDQTPIPHNIEGIDKICFWHSWMIWNEGTCKVIPTVVYSGANNLNNNAFVHTEVSTTGVVIMAGTNRSNTTARFIIYFTKAS